MGIGEAIAAALDLLRRSAARPSGLAQVSAVDDKSAQGENVVLSLQPGKLAEASRTEVRQTIDRLLVELAAGGDRDRIFEEIYALYAEAILLFFLRRGFSPEDSHDMRQETFLNLFRGIATFKGQSSFDTWLFGIAANIWRNRLRDSSALRRSGQEVSLSTRETRAAVNLSRQDQGEQEGRLAERELRTRLGEALSELPPKMRQCALLRFRQGLKYREIAGLMGTSVATVKVQIHQARGRLRERLADVISSSL